MKKGIVITEKMVTVFAPDGSWQPMMSGENMAECIGIMEFMHNKGVSMSFQELSEKGFKLLPVNVTIEIIGNEEDAFQEMKKSL